MARSGTGGQRIMTINNLELKSKTWSIKLRGQQCACRFAKKIADKNYSFANVYGVLKAAYQGYEDGLLIELKRLVRADLLDDFLSQAEMLLDQGYHVPAASLAGAILEDTLRKLCDVNSISYPDKTKIDALNIELAKRDIYDKLIQKEITAKADLRNNADHGKFNDVRESDVKDMVRWIRRFVTERLR